MKPSSWKLSLLQASLIAFISLLIFNWPQRNDPPYWDGVIGSFHQAAWLSRHELSYSALLSQPSLGQCGPRVSLISGLAFFYAHALSISSPQTLIFILHIATWALAGLSLGIGYQLLREKSDPWTSAGWMAVAALDPIFSAQAGAIYLEIPLACCTMLVIHLCRYGWYRSAAASCVLGVFIKPTVTVIAFALLIWLIFSKLSERFGKVPGILDRAAPMLILPIFILGASYPFVGNYASGNSPQILHDWIGSLKQEFPFQALVCLGTILACALVLLQKSIRDRFTSESKRFGLVSLLAICVWGFWLAHAVHDFPLCRYLAVITVPTLVLLGLCVEELLPRRGQQALILSLLTLYGANQHGALLPTLPPDYGRSGRMLERSRESLQDIAQQRELCRVIEEKWPNEPILAKYPTIHMLALPELGYVRAECPVVAVGIPAHGVARLRIREPEFEGPEWRRALAVYSPQGFDKYAPSLAPGPKDEILWEKRLNGAPLIIYRRNRS
jgi:hypothetical protein